jgi:hypothetical protein
MEAKKQQANKYVEIQRRVVTEAGPPQFEFENNSGSELDLDPN